MRAYHPTPATKTRALWREIGLPASRGTVLVNSIKMGFSVDVDVGDIGTYSGQLNTE